MPAKKAGPPPAPVAAEGPSFEERLAALEGVVKDLEGEDLSLEASIARYREGVRHLEACRALLDEAERRLVELTRGAAGETAERALRVGDEGLEPDDPA